MPSRQELISFFALSLATTTLALPLSVSRRTNGHTSSQGLPSSLPTDRKLLLTRAEFSQGGTSQVVPPWMADPNSAESSAHQHSFSNTNWVSNSLLSEALTDYGRESSGLNEAPSDDNTRHFAAYDSDHDQHSSAAPPPPYPNELFESLAQQAEYSSRGVTPPPSYPKFSFPQHQQSPDGAIQAIDPRILSSDVPIADPSTRRFASNNQRPPLSADRASTLRTSSSPYAPSDASTDSPQVKKRRTLFNTEQVRRLEGLYGQNPYPEKKIKGLAKDFGLEEKFVRRWFNNRRQRDPHLKSRRKTGASGPKRRTGASGPKRRTGA